MNAQEMWRSCIGKSKYNTEAFAKKIAARRGVELRVYYCGCCQHFHLTKKGEAPKTILEQVIEQEKAR